MKRIVLLVGLLHSPCFAVAEEEAEFRLPAGIVPQSQFIELRIDPAQPGYTGRTSIELTVEQISERIGVYKIGLNMTSIVLAQAGNAAQGGGPAFPQIFAYTCSAENLEMMKKFFNDRGDMFTASLGRAVETAETCINRKDRYAEDLQTFLQPYEVED